MITYFDIIIKRCTKKINIKLMKIFGNIFEKFRQNARNKPQNRHSNRI